MLALNRIRGLQIAVRERTLPKRSVNILRWPLETRPQQSQTTRGASRGRRNARVPRPVGNLPEERSRGGQSAVDSVGSTPLLVVDARALRDALAASGDDADDDALADALAA